MSGVAFGEPETGFESVWEPEVLHAQEGVQGPIGVGSEAVDGPGNTAPSAAQHAEYGGASLAAAHAAAPAPPPAAGTASSRSSLSHQLAGPPPSYHEAVAAAGPAATGHSSGYTSFPPPTASSHGHAVSPHAAAATGGGTGSSSTTTAGLQPYPAIPKPGPSPLLLPAPRISCRVGPAVKHTAFGQSASSAYYVYPVTTTTSLPGWSAPTVTVRRRFKDVVALSQALSDALPGYFLPQRPHRNQLKTRLASKEFLEDRRAGLERYLRRLCAHPVASSSQALQLFLEVDSDLRSHATWQAACCPARRGLLASTARLLKQMAGREPTTPPPREAAQPARATGDVLRLVREQLASVQGVAKAAQLSPQEQALRTEAERLEEVQKRLAAMSAKADAWVASSMEVSQAASGLARALRGLASYDEAYAAGHVAEDALAGAAAQFGALSAQCCDHSARELTPLHDCLDDLPQAQAALAAREGALLSALTLESTLARRRGTLDAARAGGPAQQDKANALEAEVRLTEESAAAARAEYERLAGRNEEELARLRARLQADLTTMARELALVQVASAQKAEQLWQEAAASLNSMC